MKVHSVHLFGLRWFSAVIIAVFGILTTIGSSGGGGGSAPATTLDTDDPVSSANPTSRTYRNSLTVSLSCSDTGGSGCGPIYYTLDNSDPTTASLEYVDPLVLSSTTTLKYFATDNAGNHEAIQTQTYTLSSGPGTFKHVFATSESLFSLPSFFNTDNYRLIQLLYTPERVGGSGYIDSLSFFYGSTTSAAVLCPDSTIRLGTTSLAVLTITFDDNVNQGQGSLQTVFNPTTINLPAESFGYEMTIPFDTPFYYNGVDNLVVELERDAACNGTVGIGAYNIFDFGDTMLLTPTVSANGTLSIIQPRIAFEFSGGDELVFNSLESVSSSIHPFSQDIYTKTQVLYYADEINGQGPVLGVGLLAGNPAPAQSYLINVRMGHSDKPALDTTFAGNFKDVPVTIANQVTFKSPGEQPMYSTLWLPVPDDIFVYNGTDNLIVEIETIKATGTTGLSYAPGSGTIRRILGTAGAVEATLTEDLAYGLKLRFAGSTVDIITAGFTPDPTPYNTSANRHQYLIHAAELGSGGLINQIAYRSDEEQILSINFQGCRIALGHTSSATLGSTSFAGNNPGAEVVFDGNTSVPILHAGDWIELPFTTEFAYDGISNLVVERSCNIGTGIVPVRGTLSSVRYPDRRAYNSTSDTDDMPENTGDRMIDMRLWLK